MKTHQILLSIAIILFLTGTYVEPICANNDRGEDDADSNDLRVNDDLRVSDFNMPFCGEDEIIVKFHDELSEEQRYNVIQMHNGTVKNTCPRAELYLLRIPEERTPYEMVETLGQHESVEYAELNYYATISLIPDDTYFSYPWNMDDPNHTSINMEAAWNIQTGDPNVIIAVLDTGIAYEDYDIYTQAPDLAETLFVPGYDFVNNDEHPNDDEGHGTHVAGAAGLIISNGVTDPNQVREALEMTAKDPGDPGRDDYYGWGLLNVAAVLEYIPASEPNSVDAVDNSRRIYP